jgi:hypothetical protein
MTNLLLNSHKEVEEIIVETVIAGLLVGKIDQINSMVHIISSHGRNHSQDTVSSVREKLNLWY